MGVCNVDAVGLGLVEYMYVVCHDDQVQLACCLVPLCIALLNVHCAYSSAS